MCVLVNNKFVSCLQVAMRAHFTSAFASFALIYILACVMYLVTTRSLGTPFMDSQSDAQRALLKQAKSTRRTMFWCGALFALIVVALWDPFRVETPTRKHAKRHPSWLCAVAASSATAVPVDGASGQYSIALRADAVGTAVADNKPGTSRAVTLSDVTDAIRRATRRAAPSACPTAVLRYSPVQSSKGGVTVTPPPVVIPVTVRHAPADKSGAATQQIVVDVSTPTARGMRWPTVDAALEDVTLAIDFGSTDPTASA